MALETHLNFHLPYKLCTQLLHGGLWSDSKREPHGLPRRLEDPAKYCPRMLMEDLLMQMQFVWNGQAWRQQLLLYQSLQFD